MNCEDVRGLLPWYVRGALEAEESCATAEHLTECAACRQELAEVVRLQAALQPVFRKMPRAPLGAWEEMAAKVRGTRLARLDVGSFLAGLSIGMSYRRGRLPVSGQLRVLGRTVPLFQIGKGGRND